MRLLPLFSKTTLGIVLGLTLVAGLAWAKDEAQDPIVRARIDAMRLLKQQTTILGDMATGKAPFDAAIAEATSAALIDTADKLPVLFAKPADDPVSDALPDIWGSPNEFHQKINRLMKAGMNLDLSNADDLADSMAPLGAACKDCHGRFKM